MEFDKKKLLPFYFLAIGIFVYLVLVLVSGTPAKRKAKRSVPIVETVTADKRRVEILVEAEGTVVPLDESKIASQVAGIVVWKSERMLAGGIFRAGEAIFKIDSRDYEAVVERAKSEVAIADEQFAVVLANSKVARSEWEAMREIAPGSKALGVGAVGGGNRRAAKPNDLVLYKPQLRSAEARLGAAKAELKRAELDLERTTILAPFNCFVKEISFGVGQYLRPGEVVATLVGTDAVEVIVPLPDSDYVWVARALEASDSGSLEATVERRVDSVAQRHLGYVVRLLKDVNLESRMHRAVVRVETQGEPEDIEAEDMDGTPIEVGSFVRVEIHAGFLDAAVVLPRAALRRGSTLWVYGADDSLEIRKIEIARRTKNSIYVSEGLASGEKVVLSNLVGAVAGMRLKGIEVDRK